MHLFYVRTFSYRSVEASLDDGQFLVHFTTELGRPVNRKHWPTLGIDALTGVLTYDDSVSHGYVRLAGAQRSMTRFDIFLAPYSEGVAGSWKRGKPANLAT